jgi:hypothetical protein
MAQSIETKLNKRFDQNIEITGTLNIGGNTQITGTLTVGGSSVLTSIPSNISVSTVRITSTSDASTSSTGHGLQVGSTSSLNMIMDNNELMARNNGAVSGLNFNPDGGDVTFHNNTSAGNVTIGGNQVIHAGNIGSQSVSYASSAGDAGTIDGIDSSRIIYGNNTSGTNEGNYSNWNTLSKTGFYSHSGATGRWSSASDWSSVLHFKLYDNDNNFASQLGFNTYDNRIYARTNNAGTWTAWDEIITTGNKDSFTYPPASHTHSYLPLSGGTLTGALTLTGGGSINLLTLSGSSPTLAFTDVTSGADDFYIHVNSNNFYILRDQGGVGTYGDWDSPHPLQLEADTGNAYVYGNTIITSGNIGSQSVSYASNAGTLDGLDSSAFALAHSHPYLSDNSDSEQTIGSKINYFNVGSLRMNMDPRWNEGGYDGDNGNLHIWSTRADGGNYGRAGIALYNGSAYQYLTTKGGQSNLYINNNVIWNAGNDGSGSGLDADLLDGIQGSSFLRSDAADTFTGILSWGGAGGATAIDMNNGDIADLNLLKFSDNGEGMLYPDGAHWYYDGNWRAYLGFVQSDESIRGPIFYDSNNTGYYTDPASTSNVNRIEAYGEVLSAQVYNDPDIVFAVLEQDTTESVRAKFRTSSSVVVRVDDSTAPSNGCFQITGAFYPEAFTPWYKIDEGDEYIFEFWIKYVSGTDTDSRIYAGARFYDANKSYLGNSQRYWGEGGVEVDANSNNGGWYHVSGTLGPNRGGSTGDIPTAAEWMRLLFLFNYNGGSATVTRYCGLKVYKSDKTVTKLYRKTLGSEFWSTANRDLVVDSNGDLYGTRLIDANNNTFILDPDGTSYINKIRTSSTPATPRYDTAFYVLQAQHWYGDSGSQTMYLGESGNDVLIRGQVAIGGTAIQSGHALTMSGHVDLNNHEINYVSQLHFQDNVRFYDDGNDNYLNFKWGNAGAGGIKFYDGNTTLHGYIYGDGGGRFGLLDNDGNWAVKVGIGSEAMALLCNNNAEFYVYDSYTYSPGSSRAPIFYDSGNTAYYVDSASTSKFNQLDLNYLDVNSNAAYGIRFWGGSHNYSIRMSQSSDSTYGGRVAGETTSDYNMYFTMAGGTNRGFVFRSSNSSGSCVAGIDASGTIRTISDVIAYASSDKRLKDNITPIDNAIDKVQKISGVTFDWNDKQDTYEHGKHDVGVIAQEIEEVLPEVVDTRENGYKAVKYEKIVPLLIEAIKEQQKQIDELKKLINP